MNSNYQLSEMDKKLDTMVDDYRLIRRELPKHIIINHKLISELNEVHVSEIRCGFGSVKCKTFRGVEILESFNEPFIRLMD